MKEDTSGSGYNWLVICSLVEELGSVGDLPQELDSLEGSSGKLDWDMDSRNYVGWIDSVVQERRDWNQVVGWVVHHFGLLLVWLVEVEAEKLED